MPSTAALPHNQCNRISGLPPFFYKSSLINIKTLFLTNIIKSLISDTDYLIHILIIPFIKGSRCFRFLLLIYQYSKLMIIILLVSIIFTFLIVRYIILLQYHFCVHLLLIINFSELSLHPFYLYPITDFHSSYIFS